MVPQRRWPNDLFPGASMSSVGDPGWDMRVGTNKSGCGSVESTHAARSSSSTSYRSVLDGSPRNECVHQFEVKFVEIAKACRIPLGSLHQQTFIRLRPEPRRCRYSDAHHPPKFINWQGKKRLRDGKKIITRSCEADTTSSPGGLSECRARVGFWPRSVLAWSDSGKRLAWKAASA